MPKIKQLDFAGQTIFFGIYIHEKPEGEHSQRSNADGSKTTRNGIFKAGAKAIQGKLVNK